MSHPCIVQYCDKIGTHSFPVNPTRRAQWIQAIKIVKPGLTIKKYSRICSAHFCSTEFNRRPLSVLQPNIFSRILKKSAIPSIFPWKINNEENPSTSDMQTLEVNEITKTYARDLPTVFVEEQPYFNAQENEFEEDPLKLSSIIGTNNVEFSSRRSGYSVFDT